MYTLYTVTTYTYAQWHGYFIIPKTMRIDNLSVGRSVSLSVCVSVTT